MEEFTTCQVCLERFDANYHIPLLLEKCQHSFCSPCLKKMYKTPNQLECPICRQKSMKKFEELPKNRLILQYIELNTSSTTSNTSNINQAHRQPPTQPSFSNSFNVPNTSIAASAPQFQMPGGYQDFGNVNHHNLKAWDEKVFFKNIFDDIDHNRDGLINFKELHEALERGNPNSQFDQKTVKVLLSKYDKDHDNQINFDEFHTLFVGINNQYNEFLDIDLDFSGTIDHIELRNSLESKGYNLERNFLQQLLDQIRRFNGNHLGVTFDMYVRIIARIDHLGNLFKQNQNHYSHRKNFETFLRENFFLEF